MAEAEPATPSRVDPTASPFEPPPIEGVPYDDGSLEDRAVKRLIALSESDREARSPNQDELPFDAPPLDGAEQGDQRSDSG